MQEEARVLITAIKTNTGVTVQTSASANELVGVVVTTFGDLIPKMAKDSGSSQSDLLVVLMATLHAGLVEELHNKQQSN